MRPFLARAADAAGRFLQIAVDAGCIEVVHSIGTTQGLAYANDREGGNLKQLLWGVEEEFKGLGDKRAGTGVAPLRDGSHA